MTSSSRAAELLSQRSIAVSCSPQIINLLKKVVKKDETTRVKAVQELVESLKETEDLNLVVEHFIPVYKKAALFDEIVKVRQGCHDALGIICAKLGKSIMPYMGEIFPVWLCGCFDAACSVRGVFSFDDSKLLTAVTSVYSREVETFVTSSLSNSVLGGDCSGDTKMIQCICWSVVAAYPQLNWSSLKPWETVMDEAADISARTAACNALKSALIYGACHIADSFVSLSKKIRMEFFDLIDSQSTNLQLMSNLLEISLSSAATASVNSETFLQPILFRLINKGKLSTSLIRVLQNFNLIEKAISETSKMFTRNDFVVDAEFTVLEFYFKLVDISHRPPTEALEYFIRGELITRGDIKTEILSRWVPEFDLIILEKTTRFDLSWSILIERNDQGLLDSLIKKAISADSLDQLILPIWKSQYTGCLDIIKDNVSLVCSSSHVKCLLYLLDDRKTAAAVPTGMKILDFLEVVDVSLFSNTHRVKLNDIDFSNISISRFTKIPHLNKIFTIDKLRWITADMSLDDAMSLLAVIGDMASLELVDRMIREERIDLLEKFQSKIEPGSISRNPIPNKTWIWAAKKFGIDLDSLPDQMTEEQFTAIQHLIREQPEISKKFCGDPKSYQKMLSILMFLIRPGHLWYFENSRFLDQFRDNQELLSLLRRETVIDSEEILQVLIEELDSNEAVKEKQKIRFDQLLNTKRYQIMVTGGIFQKSLDIELMKLMEFSTLIPSVLTKVLLSPVSEKALCEYFIQNEPVKLLDFLIQGHYVFKYEQIKLEDPEDLEDPEETEDNSMLVVSRHYIKDLLHVIFEVIGDASSDLLLSLANQSIDIRTGFTESWEKAVCQIVVDPPAIVIGSRILLAIISKWPNLLNEFVEENKQLRGTIEQLFKIFYSNEAVKQELSKISSYCSDGSFKMQYSKTSFLLGCFMDIGELKCSLNVTFSDVFPLKAVSYVPSSLPVTKQKEQRLLLSLIRASTVSEGVFNWKESVQAILSGVDECYICYCVVTQGNLPTKKCNTCKNAYHNTCIYKWFKTSGKTLCPICQSPF
jgi:FANCL C-terminal domain